MPSLYHFFRCLLFILLTFPAWSQNNPSLNSDSFQIHILHTTDPIIIDGVLDEDTWNHAIHVENFWQHEPLDGILASQRTVAAIAYDDRFLYVAAICYDEDEYYIETLKRDNWGTNDEFGILLDPIGQKALAYGFGVNAFGSQTEGLITTPSIGDGTWDNRWSSAVTRSEGQWIVEIAIPYKSMRFPTEKSVWGIQLLRGCPGKNERQVWAPVPRQFGEFDLGYFGSLVFDTAPEGQGSNIAVIPYVKGTLQSTGSSDKTTKFKTAIGGDAKIALTPTLNLDLTSNPDFSQVEVDQQVTNLTRFGIFFPERRQFFIENNDVFTGVGPNSSAEQPFYSRRIGLDDSGNTVPILYGVRMTGNVSPQLRAGVFNIHQQIDSTRDGQNYSAVTLQQRIGGRSFIKGLFLNRQGFNGSDATQGDYGRNIGAEFEKLSNDGVWQWELGGITSLKEGYSSKNNQVYGRAAYSGQRFRTFLEVQNMGENYFSDMGFVGRLEQYDPISDQVVRVGFTQFSNMIDYYTYPKSSRNVNYHWSGLENFVYLNPDGTLNEWYTRLRHFIFYKNTSILRFRLNYNYVDLIYPFAITEPPLPATSYNMTELNIQYNSDTRKKVSFDLFTVYGQFYNGSKWTSIVNLTFRRQPWGNFSVGVEQNIIRFPEPYEDLDLTLANARVEINFTTTLYWTTFLQYNTQANNFNLNSRLQWRFAPMSDIYVVYTDNYIVEPAFEEKDRTLVLKMNYWLSL